MGKIMLGYWGVPRGDGKGKKREETESMKGGTSSLEHS